jgi:hypothetical protein
VDKPDTARSAERRFVLGVNDPKPLSEVASLWRVTAQAATIAIAAIMFIAALYFARPVLLPATTAMVIGLMLGPLSSRADRLGVPTLVTAIVLWLLVIGVFYAVIVLLSAPIGDWISKAPEIGANIKQKLHVLDRPLDALEGLRKSLMPDDKERRPSVSTLSACCNPPCSTSRRRSARSLFSSAHYSSISWAVSSCGMCWLPFLTPARRGCACSRSSTTLSTTSPVI